MKSKLVRKNPIQVPNPVGKYSHITIIPKDATMYAFSGQIGVGHDDQLPKTIHEQITNTLKKYRNYFSVRGNGCHTGCEGKHLGNRGNRLGLFRSQMGYYVW